MLNTIYRPAIDAKVPLDVRAHLTDRAAAVTAGRMLQKQQPTLQEFSQQCWLSSQNTVTGISALLECQLNLLLRSRG